MLHYVISYVISLDIAWYRSTSIVHCSLLAVFYRRVGPGEFGPRFRRHGHKVRKKEKTEMNEMNMTKWQKNGRKMAEEWQKNGRICIWEGRMLRDREVMWRLCGAQRGKVWSTWQLRLLRPSRPSNTKWTKSARPHSLCARPLHRSSPSSLRIWCWARNLGPTWTKLRHGWFPGSFLGHK